MAVIMYKGRGSDEYRSEDGGKTFTNQSTGEVSSGKTGTSQYGYSSGNNQYTGSTGKTYNVSGANGAITVNRPDGTTSTVQRGDANYAATLDAMQKDGVNYTPNHTYTNQNGTYTTKDYTAGNSDLQYALQQAAKTNPGISVGDYAESLYNRVGSTRSDGSTVTLDDVTKELTRLGLQDYLPGNAVYTAGQNLLPGNEFGRYGEDTTGDEGQWYFYGGQQYRVGGDQADFVNYVNGKTGNLNNNLSYIFGDMDNNPYAQQDPAFMQQYLQGQSQFNNANGLTGNTGSITGNQKVDDVINYWNSMNNYGNVSGNSGSVGTSSLLELLQGYLDSGLEANKGFLEQQKALAQQNAEKAASDAYVNQMLQQDAVRQQMSALGLGTSGALQSAQMGIQGNYGNNLSEINSNLNTMLSSLSEQELQMLTDYYNNMANYAYDVTQYEQQQALQQAQLALQQQQMQYNQQMAERELAMQQAKWDWEMQNYANEQQQYQNETDYTRKQQEAKYYAQLYDAGQISALQYQLKLQELGLISGMTGNTAGSNGNANAKSGGTTKKSSGTKTTAQQPANSAVNVEPIYQSLGFRNPLYIAEKYLI